MGTRFLIDFMVFHRIEDYEVLRAEQKVPAGKHHAHPAGKYV
jgi:hypothetical protein